MVNMSHSVLAFPFDTMRCVLCMSSDVHLCLDLSLCIMEDDEPEGHRLRERMRHPLSTDELGQVEAQRMHENRSKVLDVEHCLPADLSSKILEHQCVLIDQSLCGQLGFGLQHDAI